MIDNGHAKLSPSKRVRWSACPGSVREEAKYPEEPSGPAAIDGTHTHTVLEYCLKNPTVDPLSLVGTTMKDHEGEFLIHRERIERVRIALEYIALRRIELGVHVLRSEEKVDPAPVVGRDDMSGTADVQIISDPCYEIIDYKDGMSEVLPDSLQLKQYFVAGVHRYADPKKGGRLPFQKARLTIVQPKLALKGLKAVNWVEFDANELYEHEVTALVAEGQAIDASNALLIAGDHCEYCRARGACPEANRKVMDSLGVAVQQFDAVEQLAEKEPTVLSDGQLRELIESAPLIRNLLEAAEAEALRRMEAGQDIPGLKLVRGRGSYSWSLPEEEMEAKLRKFGIPKDALWKTTLVSPNAAKKITWQKRDGTQCQLTERQVKTMEKEYIKKTDGKLQVAAASDSRAAVVVSAASMFSPIASSEAALPSWLS